MSLLKEKVIKIVELAKENPNDQTFGEILQNIASDNREKNFTAKMFFCVTRGNAQQLGERVRTLVNNARNTKEKFSEFLKRYVHTDTKHPYLKQHSWIES